MFTVQVYSNVPRGNLLLDNWTDYVSGLTFSSEAFGGFASCAFTLRKDYQTLFNIVEGTTNSPTYISNRVRITDERGSVCYEGKIHTLTLTHGSTAVSRSLDELHNIAKMNYTLTNGMYVWAVYSDATSRGLFGNRVFMTDLEGVFANGTNPLNRATRYVTTHKAPSKPTPQTTGGGGDDLSLEVNCVGLSEELLVRYAWNSRGAAVDTGQIVKDLLRAGATPSGAGSWRGQNGWNENLHTSFGASGSIPFQVESIEYSNLNSIATTSVTIAPNEVQGQSRWEIIRACAAYGSSNNKRLLFQVWDQQGRSSTAQNGKGLAVFAEQPTARSTASSYTGYFNNTRTGVVMDTGGAFYPPWLVRAGQWMTTVNVPAKNYGGISSVFDDPRAFWIERAEYDADNYRLTLHSDNDFDVARLLANLLAGSKTMRIETERNQGDTR